MINRLIFDSLTPWGILRQAKRIAQAEEVVYASCPTAHNGRVFLPLLRLVCRIAKVPVRHLDFSIIDFFTTNEEAVNRLAASQAVVNPDFASALVNSFGATPDEAADWLRKVWLAKLSLQLQIRDWAKAEGGINHVVTDSDPLAVFDAMAAVFVDRMPKWLGRMALNAAAVVLPFRQWRRFADVQQRHEISDPPEMLIPAHSLHADSLQRSYNHHSYMYDPHRNGVYFTDMWELPDEDVRAKIIAGIRAEGTPVVDYRNFTLTQEERRNIRREASILKGRMLPALSSWTDLGFALRLLASFLLESACIANYHCAAMLCMDDYSDRHFVRTWLHRRKRILSIGIHHSASNGIVGGPSLAFLCVDHLLTWSPVIRALYEPFWRRIPKLPYGYNRIDSILDRINAPDWSPPIVPAPGRKVILFALPGFNSLADWYAFLPNAQPLMEALSRLPSNVINNCELHFRPRRALNEAEFLQALSLPNVYFAQTATTPENIACADLVVAMEGSGIMVECAVLRRPIITYEFTAIEKDYWQKYGKDIYSVSAKDLCDRICRFVLGDELSADYNRLWNDLADPYQLNRNEMIRQIIKENQ